MDQFAEYTFAVLWLQQSNSLF